MSDTGRSWRDRARARVAGWLGERSVSRGRDADSDGEMLSTEDAHRREGAPSTWRHAGDQPTEVEPHDDERPGLATYGPEDETARVAPDPERPDRTRPAADDQGLHIAEQDDPPSH